VASAACFERFFGYDQSLDSQQRLRPVASRLLTRVSPLLLGLQQNFSGASLSPCLHAGALLLKAADCRSLRATKGAKTSQTGMTQNNGLGLSHPRNEEEEV